MWNPSKSEVDLPSAFLLRFLSLGLFPPGGTQGSISDDVFLIILLNKRNSTRKKDSLNGIVFAVF
jgi:hypothetical protein